MCDEMYDAAEREMDDYREEIRRLKEELSCHAAKVEEPLAVLADRKGYFISVMWTEIREEIKQYCIQIKQVHKDFLGEAYTYFAPTYAECEAKARQYLNGLTDKKEGV